MRVHFLGFLLLFSVVGCIDNSITQVAPMVIQNPPYDITVVNSPPNDMGLPKFFEDNSTLYLGNRSELHSKTVFSHEDACIVTGVTISYSPDYSYVTIAKRCIASHGLDHVYLMPADGIGLIRTIVGYDTYEGGTNRPIEWAPDSKSFLYYRARGFSDAHGEVFTGLFRYYIETAERKYLAPMWGQFKWSPSGKWIAVLDTRSTTNCKILYLLDSQGESLWELDSICINSDFTTEIVWQRDVLVILQMKRENQTIISTKEYKTDELSFYKKVIIK